MKKSKSKSEASLRSTKSENQMREDIVVPPLDTLVVQVLSLRLPDNDLRYYAIKVTFFDQLILSGVIKPISNRDMVQTKEAIAKGTMNYDPSDYEKMCLFADSPLIVTIQPLKNYEYDLSDCQFNSPAAVSPRHSSSPETGRCINPVMEILCCNIDILPLFLDTDKLCVKSRMQPMITPTVLQCKSWDNLPLLTMKLSVSRNERNRRHHEFLKNANYMKITMIGAYNLLIPYDDEALYIAASKAPTYGDANWSTVTFNDGCMRSQNFNSTNFYPKWENLRVGQDVFSNSDDRIFYQLDEVQNDYELNLDYYLTQAPNKFSTVWGSFHRSLILGGAERWFWKRARRLQWPLEVHVYTDQGAAYRLMACLDLFHLLYPGVSKVCTAVPLQWLNAKTMMDGCDCDLLLTPFEKASGPTHKGSSKVTESTTASNSAAAGLVPRTGADDSCAFVLVEVRLRRPLQSQHVPPHIFSNEIEQMLVEMEHQGTNKRECSGRGQLARDWQATVRSAANSLQRVPHHGLTEFCMFNRQLSETRTRVEITTSCWQDAAIFVNNNFVVEDNLKSKEQFEELLMMAHVCLMKVACDTLVGVDSRQDSNPVLRAARQARQLQDIPHATELYLQVVVERPTDTNNWRELATCLKDVDLERASVCMDKALKLSIRHPLNLLAKGCMVFEADPDAAELFFMALLALYPFWTTAWVIASAYFTAREHFHMAEKIMELMRSTLEEGRIKDKGGPRTWERELGDWWEATPLLPATSRYHDAADLLLRLRAMPLADVCLSISVREASESAAYFHLVALGWRLRGAADAALCHLHAAADKHGEINYLKSLEAECYHKMKDNVAAKAAFEKCGTCTSPYGVLLSLTSWEPARVRSALVDLLRRQPSAYAWLALADDWMQRVGAEASGEARVAGEAGAAGGTEEQAGARACAVACAEQALRWDRRAGRAWALLARLVRPEARKAHCSTMAADCGYYSETVSAGASRETSLQQGASRCHLHGAALRDCACACRAHLVVGAPGPAQ